MHASEGARLRGKLLSEVEIPKRRVTRRGARTCQNLNLNKRRHTSVRYDKATHVCSDDETRVF